MLAGRFIRKARGAVDRIEARTVGNPDPENVRDGESEVGCVCARTGGQPGRIGKDFFRSDESDMAEQGRLISFIVHR